MFNSVNDIFEGAAAKFLSAVDAEKTRSHQHEIGGLPSVGFKRYLGEPGKEEEYRFRCVMAYIREDDDIEMCEDIVTWYDSRRKVAHRSPEYRLYYKDNSVTNMIHEGDLFLIAKKSDGSLLLIFCPPDSSAEHQLRHLFGIGSPGERFSAAEMPEKTLILPLKLLLEEIGISAFDEKQAENDLDIVLDRFPDQFPKTADFSNLARELTGLNALDEPDAALVGWMEREEALFRAYERHIVQQRLREGFGPQGDDVDEFISFSLSVQNRRKSRVGHAFENHLGEVFNQNGLPFEKGGGKRVTENSAKPDFLFPNFEAYHSESFCKHNVFLLGAKTTCKDRWRQVLAEGDKLDKKYLATLEPGISYAQTREMEAKNLQLVVPASVHGTFNGDQQKWLFTLGDFVNLVKKV